MILQDEIMFKYFLLNKDPIYSYMYVPVCVRVLMSTLTAVVVGLV